MTGAIFGVFGVEERAETEAVGRRLAHRGAHQLILSPARNVRLGWRVPHVVAQSSEQPEVPLVFSGAITNRAQIAASLGYDVPRTSMHEDARLLWELYRRRGPQAFSRLNGQFALALFDAAAGSLVLAVDPWVTQPLYLATVGGRWVFATEYKALLALRDLEPRIDPEAAGVLQATKYLGAGQGLLAGVYPLAPGEYVRISDAGREAASYAPLELEVRAHSSEAALAAELRETLLAATRRITEGFDRIGIALSAGLDSTLTLGAVRAVAPHKPVYTYTASFDPNDPDLELAAQAARHFGTTHRQIILSPRDLPSLLPELVWRMEDPVAREEMLVYLMLSQEAARDVPLVLYGHMADVLFGGMPRHLLIKAAGDLPYFREPIIAFYDYTQTGVTPRSLLGRMLVSAYYRGRQTPPPRVLGASGRGAAKHLHLSGDEPLNAALLAAARTPTEVAAMERLHAWAAVRFGSIFHDLEVARCAFRIPDRLKIRGRCRKYILRQAATGILPPSFAARPKGLIRISRDRRLTRVVDSMAAQMLSPGTVSARGLFEVQDLARLRRQRQSGEYTEEQFYHLWTALLLEMWLRIFVDGRGTRMQAPSKTAIAL